MKVAVSDQHSALECPRPDDPARGSVRAIHLWWSALAATLIPVSLIWDFSWESTIGVDRFWSPPHLAIYISVWLSGLLGLWLVIVFTRARQQSGQAAGVNIFRLCGPSGAWVLLWGAVVMQAAFLLDGWWQRAYGLGAGLWPPPQILKTVGFFTLLSGSAMLCAAARSNSNRDSRTAAALLAWHGGLWLTLCTVVMMMKNYPNWHHTAWFYTISSAIYPALLPAVARTLPGRWGATRAALAYAGLVCVTVWLLPLFPARPLTAPINNPTDHMMPPPFPLLLVVPALLVDWLSTRFPVVPETRRHYWLAVASGVGFVVVFIPAQWFFAKFLLSPLSDNWFFAGGGAHWPFFLKIDQARVMFWDLKQDSISWRTGMLAMLLAAVSSWIGLRAGAWLSRLRR